MSHTNPCSTLHANRSFLKSISNHCFPLLKSYQLLLSHRDQIQPIWPISQVSTCISSLILIPSSPYYMFSRQTNLLPATTESLCTCYFLWLKDSHLHCLSPINSYLLLISQPHHHTSPKKSKAVTYTLS